VSGALCSVTGGRVQVLCTEPRRAERCPGRECGLEMLRLSGSQGVARPRKRIEPRQVSTQREVSEGDTYHLSASAATTVDQLIRDDREQAGVTGVITPVSHKTVSHAPPAAPVFKLGGLFQYLSWGLVAPTRPRRSLCWSLVGLLLSCVLGKGKPKPRCVARFSDRARQTSGVDMEAARWRAWSW
jgi:hypothetical protein